MTLSLPLPPRHYRRRGQADDLTIAGREYRVAVYNATAKARRLPGSAHLQLNFYSDPLKAHRLHGGKIKGVNRVADSVIDALTFAGVLRSVVFSAVDWHDVFDGNERVEVTVSVML